MVANCFHQSLFMTMTEQQATEGTNGTAAAALHESDATVEVVLSRPAYRLGGSVVGTIRLVGKQDVDPRAWFQSAEVYCAGRCKVDDRWHNPEIYKKLYGVHPHLKECMEVESKACLAEDTVCFWATNVLDLLELEERTVGRWEDVNPKALVENSGLLHDCEAAAYEDNPTEGSTQDELPLESKQLAFTFRVDLPLDIPHSAVAMCVRYSYSAVVSIKTTTNEVRVADIVEPRLQNVILSEASHSLLKQSTASCGECTFFCFDSIDRQCSHGKGLGKSASHQTRNMYSHGALVGITLSCHCDRPASSQGCDDCQSKRQSPGFCVKWKCSDSSYCRSRWRTLLYLDGTGITSHESRRTFVASV